MPEMIVNAGPPRVQYVADGIEQNYSFPFPVLNAGDLVAWLGNQQSAISFSVTGLGLTAGGSVHFAMPPLAGTRITLARRMAIKRETDFTENGEFRARALNEELDRLALLLQQIDDDASRALHASAADLPADMVLPEKTVRAGKFLSFDAEGRPTAGLLSSEGALLAAQQTADYAAAAQLSAQAAAAARDQAFSFTGQPQPFTFDADGILTSFTLPFAPANPNALWVFVGGIFQRPPAWSLSGATLQFEVAPPAGLRRVAGIIGTIGMALDAEFKFQRLAWEMNRCATQLAALAAMTGLGPIQQAPNWATLKS